MVEAALGLEQKGRVQVTQQVGLSIKILSNIIFSRFILCTWSWARAQCLNCNKKGEFVDDESEEIFEKAHEHNDDVRFDYDL